jgi:hypothetical protein
MSKLSLSRAWEETTAVLARDGRLFVPVALALFVLPGLVLNVTMPDANPTQFPPAGPWMAVAFIVLLVSLVGQISVVRLAIEPHVAVGEAIAHALRRLLPYIGAMLLWLVPILLVGSLLYGLVEMKQTGAALAASLVLIVLCFVFAFLSVRMMLASAVAAAESAGPLAILRRSWDLSRGNWWRLFAFLVLFGLGALCMIWAIVSVFGLIVRLIVADAGPRSLGGLLFAFVSLLVSALLSVVLFVMLARIYVQRSAGAEVQPSVPNSGT